MVTSYGQELVVEALKEAVYNRANNLRYIETLLSEWNKKGYKSKVDILKDRENYGKSLQCGCDCSKCKGHCH